jgi:hypothetical protein
MTFESNIEYAKTMVNCIFKKKMKFEIESLSFLSIKIHQKSGKQTSKKGNQKRKD